MSFEAAGIVLPAWLLLLWGVLVPFMILLLIGIRYLGGF